MTAADNAEAADSGTDPWTVLRLMRWSGEYLESRGIEGGRLEAEHLLSGALGLPRLQLYLQYDRPLEPEELDRFRPLLRRRAGREPLQYILGRTGFRELDLRIDRRALIPRPETEVLVDAVLEWSRSRGAGLRALDLGTGSGAIALSLAVEGAFSAVMATDVEAGPLELAKENAAATGCADRVEFRRGALFEPLRSEERFDVIVSNPPYVAEREATGLQPEVAEWEPHSALFAGDDGLAVLTPLIEEAACWMAPDGLLALEVGAGQAQDVARCMEATEQYRDVRVRRDLARRERIVLANLADTRGSPERRSTFADG